MKKKWLASIALTVVIAAIGTWFFYTPASWRQVIDRCVGYDPQWWAMLDCYGVISIWRPDNSGYLILNNVSRGWIVAEISDADNFIMQNNQMYIIDTAPKGGCAVAERGNFCRDFQVNGETKVFGYKSADAVPTYLIIDTKTGDERFYANLKDAPQADRAIFEQLLTR
jgi:hypothetical protein